MFCRNPSAPRPRRPSQLTRPHTAWRCTAVNGDRSASRRRAARAAAAVLHRPILCHLLEAPGTARPPLLLQRRGPFFSVSSLHRHCRARPRGSPPHGPAHLMNAPSAGCAAPARGPWPPPSRRRSRASLFVYGSSFLFGGPMRSSAGMGRVSGAINRWTRFFLPMVF